MGISNGKICLTDKDKDSVYYTLIYLSFTDKMIERIEECIKPIMEGSVFLIPEYANILMVDECLEFFEDGFYGLILRNRNNYCVLALYFYKYATIEMKERFIDFLKFPYLYEIYFHRFSKPIVVIRDVKKIFEIKNSSH